MLLSYYKLSEQPFGVTPDSRFLYLGPKHREALASLVYGTESNRGFLAIIAEPGMGKTTLLYHYLAYLKENSRTAFVFRTDCDSREFIRYVLIDLGINTSGMDMPTMHDTLNKLLVEEMQAGRRFVLVVDEAQTLEDKTLESIRLLSNFETPWMKLMLIVLSGQPQLANHLARPSLSQLRQRISMVIPIKPFTPEEVNAYIDHRLWVAGGKDPALFTLDARSLIAECSRGIPRNINNICFNAMTLGCALRRETIDREIVREVIAELDLEPLKAKSTVVVDFEPKPSKEASRVAERPEARPRPAVRDKQAGPTLSKVSERKTASSGSSPRIPIVSVLSLLLLGSPNQLNRNESRDLHDVAAQAAAPSSLLVPNRSADNAVVSLEQTRSISAISGQTRCGMSVENTDQHNGEAVEKARELASWPGDPGCIHSSQELPIPSAMIIPADAERPARPVRNISTTGTEQQ